MPKIRSPKTLKYITLLNIAHNMENVWYADYKKNFADGARPLYVIGPFDYVPTVLLQELMSVMIYHKLLRPAYLDIMLDHRLTQLVFRGDQHRIINRNIHAQLIASKCPNLTKLCIPYADGISSIALSSLVKSLPKLKHLDVGGTKVTDQVLAALGIHCQDLEVLDITSCYHVTDSGIFSLCLSFDKTRPKCIKLQEIIMFCPMVTTKGVKVILEKCPVIEYIGQMSVANAIVELYHESVIDGKFHEDRTYNLRELSLTSQSTYDIAKDVLLNNWRLVMSLCPLLRSVGLDLDMDLTSQWLEPLCALEQLQELHLHTDNYRIYGILSLLQSRGHNLTSLELYCNSLVNANMTTIGAHCPNLQKLIVNIEGPDMEEINGVMPAKINGEDIFTNIQTLTLKFTSPSEQYPSFLQDVLPHCKHVQTLTLDKLGFLTDETVEEVIKCNPLLELESLCLVKCNSISVEAVEMLVKSCPLQKVKMFHCSEITLRDFDELKYKADHSGWDLHLEWA